ncbi:MAG: ATP-binding cassette domain-containing protein, partial [Bacteroidota bacterium]
MPAVELVDVRKSYTEAGQERAVLTGINLSLDPGELAVLIGRSGSGKSTMLNLVSGIDQPTSGTVRVAGTDLTQLNEAERTRFRRDRIGFVFQSFNLIPTLTVGENVWLPIELQRGLDASSRQR